MLLGRDDEVALLAEVVEAAAAGSGGSLLIAGEPGIGKTRLLEEAARIRDGFTVLRAVGFESEAELPYAAAHQLLRPVLGDLEGLPPPQVAAIRGTLGLERRESADRLLVGLAILTLLANAAERCPVLCLVDDAQWADRESLVALAFAARRIDSERVAILFAARDSEHVASVLSGVRELRPRPLSREDARRLVVARYGDDFAHRADVVLDRGAGNPLALLELAAAAANEEETPTTVEQTYVAPIRRFPPEPRTLLLLAAADDPAKVATVARAAHELGLHLDALRPVEAAGLVTVSREAIRFKHPLVRSAAYLAATFDERRRAHAALAGVLSGDDEADRRAWHRAAATVGQDEDVARELEQSALRATRRSGYAAAASALERAAELSVDQRDRARRLVDAASSASLGGQPERALRLLEQADLANADTLVSVKAARLRGVVEAQHGSPAAASRIFLEAASRAYGNDRRMTLDLVTLAQESAGLAGAVGDILELGEWAERLGEGETTDERIMLGLIAGFAAITRGDRAGAAPPLNRAVELGQSVREPRLLVWSASAAMFLGDDERAHELLQRAVSEARAVGALGVLPFALVLLAGAERRAANIAAAEADAHEALGLARDLGQEVIAAGALSTLVALAAVRGDVERAEALAAETRALAAPRGIVVPLVGVARALAELDLARGRAAEALAVLDSVISGDIDLHNAPFTLFTSPLLVEAAIRTGQRERAIGHVAAFGEWAEAGALDWAKPLVARCHALIAEDPAEADAWFRRAVELHAVHRQPFERARTSLLYGEFLRRARRKTEARVHLRAAIDAFEALGAGAWAARAIAELRATGVTARKRDDSTRGELTPQELQVVRLVALGKTNPEVAAELFVSPKTVQYHLRKVFAKLGIASRNELTRLVAQGQIPGAASVADAA